MINSAIKKKIKSLWNIYVKNGKQVVDNKGVEYIEIDRRRIVAIEDIKKIISTFLEGNTDVHSFKTALDSYNKRNNLWGFTAIKGQMFFNQLVRAYIEDTQTLETILKNTITQPSNLDEALNKIHQLESLLQSDYDNAPDKRKVPKPSSVSYFLSYFWQIHNPEEWPILYSSLTNAFENLGIWEHKNSQKENYNQFYSLNEEIKQFLATETGSSITNWDVEHCFWNLHLKTIIKDVIKKENAIVTVHQEEENKTLIKANFDINDYVIPKVSNLVSLGQDDSNSPAKKGSLFKKKVAEVFELLDFDVEMYGQGSGRNPDAIIKYRKDNIAFIIDAKAYTNGYSLGLDDRAIKEYINVHCPKLIESGYKKIGFIVVSNSFNTDFTSFINDITWNTPIKRFMLLTSDGLLHLLAYKTKDKISVNQIIDTLVKLGTIITEQEIIGEFEDV